MNVLRTNISTRSEFREFQNKISPELLKRFKDDPTLVDIAIAEAITNGLYHGNGFEHNLSVNVKVLFLSSRVIIRVKDQGNGFNGNDRISKYKSNLDEAFQERYLEETGRGLLIIMKIMDCVIYNRFGNELIMMKKYYN